MATYRNSRNIGWYRFKVVKRSCGVPNDEVDCNEETTENDGEGTADNREQDILLEKEAAPGGGPAACVGDGS